MNSQHLIPCGIYTLLIYTILSGIRAYTNLSADVPVCPYIDINQSCSQRTKRIYLIPPFIHCNGIYVHNSVFIHVHTPYKHILNSHVER